LLQQALRPAAIELLENELAKRCVNDSSLFTSFIMSDPETGLYFEQDEIHKNWHRVFDEFLWNLIESAREHGKSEQAVGKILHTLGKHPNIRIKYITNNDNQSSKRVSSIADHIENNKRLRLVFPNLKPDYKTRWTGHAINIKRTASGITEPSLEGFGVLSSGTGSRADLIIFDDVVDFENTIKNPALIDTVKEAYRNKWINMLTKNGRVIYIFTRWHERDLSHDLIKEATKGKPKDEQYHYTVDLIDDQLTSISRLFPHDRLVARKNSIGQRAFARNFQGRAMSAEESLFDDIGNCCDYEYRLADIPEPWNKFVYAGVDLGHRGGAKAKKDSPYTVIFIGIRAPDGKRIPIAIERGKWTAKQTAERIVKVQQRYKPQRILVENNAYQDMLREWVDDIAIKQGVEILIDGYFTGSQKMDESMGLPNLALEFEQRKWKIPMGDQEHPASCDCWLCKWINEMKMYPVGEFSDQVMACWLFRQNLTEYSYGVDMRTGGKRETLKELEEYAS